MSDIKLNWNAQLARADFGLVPPPVERETYALQFNGDGGHVDFGDVLDAGTGNFQVAFTATPRVLDAAQVVIGKLGGDHFLRLPGASGASVSTPHPAAFTFLVSIDVRVHLSMDSWTPGAAQVLLSKMNGAGERAFYLSVTTTGCLEFAHSEDGTTWLTATSTVPLGYTAGTSHWVRATLLEDNGLGDREVTFWKSEDGSTWSVVETGFSFPGPGNIWDASAARIQISASQESPSSNSLAGSVYRAEVRGSIGGALLVLADPSGVPAVASSWVSSTGETWTVNGTAAVQSPPGWQVYWDASGNLRLTLADDAGGFVDGTVAAAANWAAGVEREVEIDFVRSGSATCRRDGIQAGTLSISGVAGSLSNSAPLRVGLSGNDGQPFDGVLDEVSVHLGTFDDDGLQGLWHFDEGQGTRASDASGHGRGGTLVDGPEWVSTGTELMAQARNDVEPEDGLETAVLISLFSDRRAGESDVLPDGTSDRRGWWGDAVTDVDGDQVGSHLWLLSRSTLTPSTVARAQQYAQEALAWLVQDQVASKVDVVASNPEPGLLVWDITIHRPEVSPVTYRYARAWAAQAGEV